MAGRDQRDDPDVQESVDAFRRAGTAASNGFRTLYEWSYVWIERRHSLVQFAIGFVVWFGGNWTYNRIAPTLIEITLASLRRMSSGFATSSAFGVLRNRPVLASVQVVMVLLVALIVQNRAQTRKLKSVESKMTTMSNPPTRSTDGGTRERPPTGPRGIGGAVIGAIVGTWFGPGGVLAGIYLGFWIGVKLDYRAHERDPLTPDLNRETRTEQ